jgi:hypothetical protein
VCFSLQTREVRSLDSLIRMRMDTGRELSARLYYVERPQSKFPTRPTASKLYIARSDCAYVIEQCCSMAHALTVLPAFSQ